MIKAKVKVEVTMGKAIKTIIMVHMAIPIVTTVIITVRASQKVRGTVTRGVTRNRTILVVTTLKVARVAKATQTTAKMAASKSG